MYNSTASNFQFKLVKSLILFESTKMFQNTRLHNVNTEHIKIQEKCDQEK